MDRGGGMWKGVEVGGGASWLVPKGLVTGDVNSTCRLCWILRGVGSGVGVGWVHCTSDDLEQARAA